jgi:hypothetical protein
VTESFGPYTKALMAIATIYDIAKQYASFSAGNRRREYAARHGYRMVPNKRSRRLG